ncbi:hypothetical protein F4804DRAFT_339385 [Jackrogersella minutella]|nr:hypothetical protein F4804DRAFT_339385 [Jackrogersella minutella]
MSKKKPQKDIYIRRQGNRPPTYDTEPVHHSDNNDESIHDINMPGAPLNGEETKDEDVPLPNQPSKEGTLDDEQDIETTTETISDIIEPEITIKSPYVEEELLDDSDIDEEDWLEVLENLDERLIFHFHD